MTIFDDVRGPDSVRAVVGRPGARSPRPGDVELVARGEFSFGAVVEVRPGHDPAFDTDGPGRVATVAPRDREPAAGERPDRRIDAGRRPRSASMRGGPRILGHAACRVAPVAGNRA